MVVEAVVGVVVVVVVIEVVVEVDVVVANGSLSSGSGSRVGSGSSNSIGDSSGSSSRRVGCGISVCFLLSISFHLSIHLFYLSIQTFTNSFYLRLEVKLDSSEQFIEQSELRGKTRSSAD